MGTKRQNRTARPFPKGRQATDAEIATVCALLGEVERGRDLLIEHLHTLNDHFGHLSAGHIAALAHVLGLAQIDVYETATFYAHFNVANERIAPVTLRICDGPACRMAGAKALLTDALAAFGDQVRVCAAPCQGACDTPPSAMLGKSRIANATLEKLTTPDTAPLPAIGDVQVQTPSDIREELHKAGLRGMGGAGFPVVRKWAFFDDAPKPRVLVVNADEGEPGTFKDRFLLETEPEKVLRGMMIAAQALDVDDVFFYLRDEYLHIHAALGEAFKHIKLEGVTLHLRRGAGAYICGEETALLDSLEGKRGQPRNRPPYPAQHGYKGRPTITHNVETLYWIADIAARGADAYMDEGHPRFYSVSGRIKNPGVYRTATTTTVADLIDMAGGMMDGHRFTAFLPGGASGGVFPARFQDKAMDFGVFEPLGGFVGSGALTVLSDHDDVWDMARTLTTFFMEESCGKCTPCRVGTEKMLGLIDTPHQQADLIRDLSATMREASICGLGQAAPNPVLTLLDHFGEDDA
ncbi:NADH-ubiquinone oxidoreductase-F iron-sulfur binding region domain-containing protein [Magnetovibrio sp.]|uniref:NADH-ubiquinone oxidoreductase-F iron-sulfur binding region domain-containing protein n=1 Tax=Magnetovibrio sp. TaxID=2024836 RepID=UPI002F95F066